MLARPRDEERTPAFRAFVGLFGASIAMFWLYTAIKAAYLSTVFATRVEERNMIYLIPLVAVAFAVFLDRPRVRLWALAASGAIVGYLLVSTPYQLSIRPYSDAPGLSVLGWANRQYRWADADVQKALLGALAFSLLFALAAAFGGRRFRAAVTPVLAAVAIGVLAWNLTGEISFANASNGQSRLFVKYLPHPLDWVDRATGRQPTAYIGEAMSEGNGTWSLEFWNRSLTRIGSLDNTAPGPGAVLRPVPFAGDGRVINDPQTPYVLAGKGVDPQGTLVAQPRRPAALPHPRPAPAAQLRDGRLPGRLDRQGGHLLPLRDRPAAARDADDHRLARGLEGEQPRRRRLDRDRDAAPAVAKDDREPVRGREVRKLRGHQPDDRAPARVPADHRRERRAEAAEAARDAAVPGPARGLPDLRARGLRRLRQPPARRPDAVLVPAEVHYVCPAQARGLRSRAAAAVTTSTAPPAQSVNSSGNATYRNRGWSAVSA